MSGCTPENLVLNNDRLHLFLMTDMVGKTWTETGKKKENWTAFPKYVFGYTS